MKKNIKINNTQTELRLFNGTEIDRYLCHIRILSEKVERGFKEDNSLTTRKQNVRNDVDLSKSDGKSCLLCGVTFLTLEEQRSHFTLDWHKYNVKQKLLQRDPVKEDEFEEMISGELSSISGSESDSAEEVLTTANPETIPLMTLSLLPNQRDLKSEENLVDRSNPKVYFVNQNGTRMSVFREVVYGAKEKLAREDIVSRIQDLPQEKTWLILMTGGGHFAGAVFSGNDVLVSKTFHRYTVRAKRGTAQGIRDNKQGGHAPRSAGATLRRYNETALVQDIQNLLESWSEHIEKCSRIFMRVPNNYKWIFFTGKKPPFEKDDLRIRVIPFPTRRATFKELENVQKKLSSVIIEENYIEECKSKTGVVRADENPEDKTIEQKTNNLQDDQSQMFKSLDNLAKKKSKSEKTSKKDNQETNTAERTQEVVPTIWIELYEAVNTENSGKTRGVIERLKDEELKHECSVLKYTEKWSDGTEKSETNESSNDDEDRLSKCGWAQTMLNEKFESYGETILHLASRLGQPEIVKILLETGGNPSIKDSLGRVPYNIAKDKETRNTFRRFMALYPDKYDYDEARIPSALTAEMEEKERQKTAEKKRAQSKARKQRLKEKKADEKIKEDERVRKEKEENEKKWFQNLSEREKRAVAAERRLGNICFNCSRSLQGLVPFERLSNKYCSTKCVQKHRKIMENSMN
ncbi:ankyrin repeat and zinc finger domain-containing protein 1-like [Dendronephthya gigantea]|uniref:ankyrin repeat and zinc finger domain-containing protein 1-like n=1 Tax=Dendronephthya gigantea TaxID=151771 RepID=UPI0010693384|nr:ankyrin repeat and zinc finger domain-containing protein 1-like [Dendronephthya gigantea]